MSRKVLNIMTIVLFAISVIVAILTVTKSEATLKADPGLLNPMYYWTVILTIVALVLALVMPLPGIISNPKSLKKTLLIIVGLAVLFIVVYVLSKGEPNPAEYAGYSAEKITLYKEGSTLANMNLIGVYIMGGLAVIAIVWSAIKGFFAK